MPEVGIVFQVERDAAFVIAAETRQTIHYIGRIADLALFAVARNSDARFALKRHDVANRLGDHAVVFGPIAVLAAIGIFAELLALAGKSPNDYVGFLGITRNPLGPVLFTSYGPATEAVTLLLFISALAVLDSRPSK